MIYACKVFPWDLRQTGKAMRRYALVLSIPNAWLVGVACFEMGFTRKFLEKQNATAEVKFEVIIT